MLVINDVGVHDGYCTKGVSSWWIRWVIVGWTYCRELLSKLYKGHHPWWWISYIDIVGQN
jgi:hypothetical protein